MAVGDSISGTFGRLEVVKTYRGRDKAGASRIYATCRCECGSVVEVMARDILRPKNPTRSCGCLKRDTRSRLKHGHSNTGSRAYSTWKAMHNRCNNPRDKAWGDYGGRGIKVCERWSGENGFANFLSDMGEPDDGKSLDRYPDNNGGYSKDNCRWADDFEQAENRRSTMFITIDGVTKTQKQWCIDKGFSISLINKRIKSGMTPEEAVTTPLIKRSGKHKER